MGKRLQHQDPSISPENPPGCMWGILHNLNNSKWNQVRKRPPQKRQSGGKHVCAVEDHGDNALVTDPVDKERVESNAENSPIVAKTAEPASVSKGSMISRIKSLITDETSKRKSRHRRSSSCPVHHLNPQDLQSSLEISQNDETLEHSCEENYTVASLLDPPTKRKRDRVVNATDACEERHSTQASKSTFGFMKSVSFPSRGSRGRRSSKSRNHTDKLECGCCAKGENESQVGSEVSSSVGFGNAEQFNSHSVTSTDMSSDDDVGKHARTRRLESFDDASSHAEKKNRESKLILNRFKNLRRKLRQALRESRKDKRIVMDAVLHKVPHGRGSPKGIKKEEQTCAHCSSLFTKSEMKYFRRTSSVNESLDRYNRLLDTCFYSEEKQNVFDRSSFRASPSPSPARTSPIGLNRILSMPDLRYYPSFKLEDSPEPSYLYTLSRTASSNNLKIENQIEEGYISDSKSSIFLDVSETFDEFGGLKTDDTSSLTSELDKSVPIPQPDMIFSNTTSSTARLSGAKGILFDTIPTLFSIFSIFTKPAKDNETDNVDTYSTGSEDGFSDNELNRIDHLQIQVDKRYEPEFNYVKDVLELSGFSSRNDKFIGKWHSADHPVSPSVFEELEICADMSCDQLLLFDLVNEVLLQIYERSCSYWPKSLTCRSHIRATPVGYHVLREVWTDINSCLESELKNDQPTDDAVSRDLANDDTWMNLQSDAVGVGVELEELILDDLLEELIFT